MEKVFRVQVQQRPVTHLLLAQGEDEAKAKAIGDSLGEDAYPSDFTVLGVEELDRREFEMLPGLGLVPVHMKMYFEELKRALNLVDDASTFKVIRDNSIHGTFSPEVIRRKRSDPPTPQGRFYRYCVNKALAKKLGLPWDQRLVDRESINDLRWGDRNFGMG
jgi:hypothetical protein